MNDESEESEFCCYKMLDALNLYSYLVTKKVTNISCGIIRAYLIL
jgi:hypothetical protein